MEVGCDDAVGLCTSCCVCCRQFVSVDEHAMSNASDSDITCRLVATACDTLCLGICSLCETLIVAGHFEWRKLHDSLESIASKS